MTDYFTSITAKPASKTFEPISSENSRPDLLLEQYKLTRQRLLTAKNVLAIDEMYRKWCDLLFSGFNVVLLGPQSKFALLQTFKTRYLDSGCIPDFKTMIDSTQAPPGVNGNGKSRRGAPRRCTISVTPDSAASVDVVGLEDSSSNVLNIVTVRLHGLEPIKLEAFNHAIFNMTESKRTKESDYLKFIADLREENLHYVFMVHSFELLIRDSEDIFESISRLCSMDPTRVHLLMSSDVYNAGKKLNNLKIKLKFRFFTSQFPESYLWEKTQLADVFDDGGAGGGGDKTLNETAVVHRLFNDNTDLQSLKDIYQALDKATQSIMTYIFKDYIEKCAGGGVTNGTDEEHVVTLADRIAGRERDGDDSDEEQEEVAAGMKRLTTMRKSVAREVALNEMKRRGKRAESKGGKRVKRANLMPTNLDFHHLLNYCESKFIIRRGAALRDHLGELKDHRLVSDDDGGNKIQCLVEARMCKKFLEWVEKAQLDE